MRDTRVALSIAFFDAQGAFISSTDMEPCGNVPNCPTYAAERPYKFALEVLKGGLPALGAIAGARLTAG
jgi:uncharacterized membrane protein (UPF0127 family)